MTSITNFHVQALSHDSRNGNANFVLNRSVGAKPGNVMGLLPIALTGDPKESEINAALKTQLADFLESLAGQIRALP
ncbi:hypothetical protein [Bradyrhizobium australafricanum]|uniref:hypothetical protein n=1 Tax=Bradyrhizobium australafricanum TaxID=2821406 RepID=UPI001CE30937|nr:hypothetical protein [Bradyrhizobium australafricanum]MCA6098869.1 hypothetical protein [Bradyrhizobium australafricanum]